MLEKQQIKVGDMIIAVSMNKILRRYIVTDIHHGVNRDETICENLTVANRECTLKTSTDIQPNKRISVFNDDRAISHINCVEYYWVDEEMKKNLERTTKKDMISIQKDIAEHIIRYCEDKAIWDKLGAYGDFYYKLKELLK